MERARFNGSQEEIIDRTFNQFPVSSVAVDPLTQKIIYSDGSKRGDSYVHRYVNRADLNGNNEIIMNACQDGTFSAEKELTVSKDYLYWVNSSVSENIIWQSPKNARYNDTEPIKIDTFSAESPITIASNYKIEDQIQSLQDCEALSSLIPINTVDNHSINTEQTTGTEATTEYTTEVDLFCVHGVHDRETSVCECTPGYIGERCDVSACVNYCLQGLCSLNEEGLPTCR